MRKPLTRREVLKWMGIGAAASIVPVAYGDYSTEWLEIERHTLRLPRWRQNGMRVVLLSDLHANSEFRAQLSHQAIDIAFAERPDLLLIGGDLINYADERRLRLLTELMARFEKPPCPVYAVLGNHDYWSSRPEKIIEVMHASPVRLLRNEAIQMDGMTLAGVDDALVNRADYGFLERLDRDSVLTLLHEPDYVDELPDHVSLMLAGHSHGGQVCLPGGYVLHTPKGALKYKKGYYPDAKVPLYVSRGIGTTGPNWRLFCRPEVSVLTLEGSQGQKVIGSLGRVQGVKGSRVQVADPL